MIFNKLFSLPKISILILLGIITSNAYAEYYLVYSAPESNVIWLDGGKSSVKHKHHKQYRKVSHKHYHRHSSCQISVYYVYPQPLYPCEGMIVEYRSSGYEYVNFSYKPYRYRTEEYKEDWYDPDMSTGDDNASIHPELNIDR